MPPPLPSSVSPPWSIRPRLLTRINMDFWFFKMSQDMPVKRTSNSWEIMCVCLIRFGSATSFGEMVLAGAIGGIKIWERLPITLNPVEKYCKHYKSFLLMHILADKASSHLLCIHYTTRLLRFSWSSWGQFYSFIAVLASWSQWTCVVGASPNCSWYRWASDHPEFFPHRRLKFGSFSLQQTR